MTKVKGQIERLTWGKTAFPTSRQMSTKSVPPKLQHLSCSRGLCIVKLATGALELCAVPTDS